MTVSTLTLAKPDCVKFCFNLPEALGLSLLLAIPFLLAALATVFALTPLMRRWLPSANMAGFATALIAAPLSVSLLYLFATTFL